MNERSPREIFDASRVLNRLFSQRITPAQAAREFRAGFDRLRLTQDEAFGRINAQHQSFLEGNFELSQRQMVDWDHLVICLETFFDTPEDARISRNRLVPPGSPVGDIPFEDMPF